MYKSPRTLSNLLFKCKAQLTEARKTIDKTKKRETRLRRNLNSLLDELKKMRLLSEEAEKQLTEFIGNDHSIAF